jgi:hypothetical protein
MPTPEIDGHALVVGVSAYDRLATLPPVHDAEDVASALQDPALCGYPAAQVHVLHDAQATRAAILGGIDDLLGRARPASTVFLYFSGHGGRIPAASSSPECYLMPVEGTWITPEDLARTAISGSELSARLERLAAGRVTVVLDCCRAAGIAAPGALPGPSPDGQLSREALSPLGRGRGHVVFAASRADGQAFATADGRNSVFTQLLLEGLRGAANGAGGVIRVCDLFHYVQQKIAATRPQQAPVFKAELEENYPVALHLGGRPAPLALPPAPDELPYDAFVSYRRQEPDRTWVEHVLVPGLEGQGLHLSLAHRDFRLGAPRLREMERAVEQSRYTIGVLTPRYLESAFEDFQALLAQHSGLEEDGAPRFIPLMRETCRPALGIRTTEWLDVTDPEWETATLLRLAQRLREPRRPPLDARGAP